MQLVASGGSDAGISPALRARELREEAQLTGSIAVDIEARVDALLEELIGDK